MRSLPLAPFGALFALCACSNTDSPPSASSRPGPKNVLVFSVDTLRADQLGAYGQTPTHTPHMDALAARSLFFEAAYSPATLTNPSLTSLWTGLLPYQHGVQEQSAGFAPGILALPAWVQGHGLATGCFLANMCKLKDVKGTVFHDGWQERFCGMLDAPEAYSDQYRWDAAVVDAGLAWIGLQEERPFLAWTHLMDPHAEHRPPTSHWDWQRDPPREKIDQYAYYNQFEALRTMPPIEVKQRLVALYAAEVAGADDQLGRMIAGLERLGRLEDTALILTADHGEELFETWVRYDHGLSMTDGVFHIPLMVSGPGIAPGRIAGPVELSQVGVTVLDLLGIEPPYALSGPSLLAPQPSRGIALSYAGNYTTSARSQKFRYWQRNIDHAPTRKDSPWRLEAPWFVEPQLLATYDTPGSAIPTYHEVQGEFKKEAQKLRQALAETHANLKQFGGALEIDDPAFRQSLADLGYIDYGKMQEPEPKAPAKPPSEEQDRPDGD